VRRRWRELKRQRWEPLPETLRRAIIAGVVGFLLLVVFAPLAGFDTTALFAYLIFVVTYVPPYRKFPLGRFVIPLAVFVLAVTYPYYGDHMFTLPIFSATGSNGFPSMDTATIITVFAMMAVGLNMVVGYAGLLDLGYVAFYAMGAYVSGWLASPQFASHTLFFGDTGVSPGTPGIHISIWLLIPLAGIVTAVIGVLIGLPTLRLRGDYLAIVTLGFGEIMPQIAKNGDNFFNTGFNLTGGPSGITPIDPPGFGHWLHNNVWSGLPSDYLSATHADRFFFWTGLALLVVTVFCSVRLRDSRLGRAWVAIREDEVAAAAMGIPLMRTKTWAYASGAFFGGVAGAFYASYKTETFPDDFFFNISVFILCMVILGGMGNVWGVLLGAAFLAYLNQQGIANAGGWLNDHFSSAHASWFKIWSSPIDVSKYTFGIYGAILLIVMLFRPEGLIPSSRRKAEFKTEDISDESLYDVQH
jgi:branched-chain amino acid transport system permease protein